MKYIENLREGDSVLGHYYCREKQTLKSNSGKTYLSLTLGDRTGAMNGKVWELNNNIQSFAAGDYIKIDGIVVSYQGEPQLKIFKIRRSTEGEFLPSDYIPTTAGDVEAMYGELTTIIKTVSNAHINKLLTNIFINDNATAAAFKEAVAAKTYHHNYAGGLLEHTLSVTQLCDFLSTRYKYVNRDVLVASAMFHDIGKIWELTGFPENDYTDTGQMLGHIYLGAEYISREISKIENFPDSIALLLKHCILSHHGDYEFGSPRLPSIIEAFILYSCDNMDAKIFSFTDTMEKDKTDSKWAGYSRMLSRNIRRTM